MIPAITIRPQPQADRSVAKAGEIGLPVQAMPLSAVRPLDWTGPDPAAIDALLVGSANAFHHGGGELDRYAGKPVFAVGPTTAEAARRCGFAVQLAGEGGLQAVLDMVPERPVRLLRLAGARHLPIAVPDAIAVDTRAVYAVDHLPMPEDLARLLRSGAVVLLHSAGAAEHLAAECDRLRIDRALVRLAALGPRIADAAGAGWGAVRWAERPSEAALLALAADLCQ